MTFAGFPRRTRFTPVPNSFFSLLLEQINDIVEFKCTLRIIWLLHQKKGFPRYVFVSELWSDRSLAKILGQSATERQAELNRALTLAVDRGTLLKGVVNNTSGRETIFALNTENDRNALKDILVEDPCNEISSAPMDLTGVIERPNIYALYENNIGMLTPMIAEELRMAAEDYPEPWIEEAIREAVTHNAANWRYVARILERWEIEGRIDGRPGRNPKKTGRKSYY